MGIRYKIIIYGVLIFLVGGLLRTVVRWNKNPDLELDSSNVSFSESHQGENPVLVLVEDEPITARDVEFERRLQLQSFENDSDNPIKIDDPSVIASLEKQILKELIERKMLFHFVKKDRQFDAYNEKRLERCQQELENSVKNGVRLLQKEDWQLRLKNRLCEYDIIRQFREERINPLSNVTDEEIKEYYEANESEYDLPERVSIRQIVLPNENEAKQVSYQTKRANFVSMAKEKSIAPEAEKGGLIGPFKRGDLPSVFDVAFRMRVGDISSVLKSTYGFHIIMVVQKYKPAKLSLNDVTDEISNVLLRNKQDEEFKKWVDVAMHTIKIERPRPLW